MANLPKSKVSGQENNIDETNQGENIAEILRAIRRMEPDLATCQTNLQKLTAKVDCQTKSFTEEITSLRQEVVSVKKTNTQLLVANKDLKSQITKLESYSRLNNLIFKNVPESGAPLIDTMCKIWSDMGIINPRDILIDDIHRNQWSKETPKPITIRFIKRTDRHKIWGARRQLKQTTYSMSEDLPEVYKKARGILVPVMKAAREAGYKTTLVPLI